MTRDRIYADCSWLDMNFTLIDTGGIEPDTKDIILSQMQEQAEIAISTADVIILHRGCAPGTGGFGRQGGRYAAQIPQAGGAGSKQGGQLPSSATTSTSSTIWASANRFPYQLPQAGNRRPAG